MVKAPRTARLKAARRARDDKGVILAFWVLCLAVLIGCFGLAINLGNLQQQAVNVQDAADSAALAATGELAPHLDALVDQYVPIPPRTCQTTATGSWLGCSSLSWLDTYYAYDSQAPQGTSCIAGTCEGWWQIVGATASSSAGEVNDLQAFEDAEFPNGPWQCWSTWPRPGTRHHNRYYCSELYTGVSNAQANWDLSYPGNNPAIEATQGAQALAGHYGVDAHWSACRTAPPSQFSLADGWDETCLAYEVAGNGQGRHVIFWVQLEADGVWRTAWATSSSGRLCSGPPGQGTGGNCN